MGVYGWVRVGVRGGCVWVGINIHSKYSDILF